MKFGVNLINFGPGANPESLTRSVNLVEAIGYHLIMSSDHIAVTPDVSSRYPAPFYEPLTTMGWLAATTQSMEIGTTVAILPYRSPQRSREQGPTSTSLVEAGSSSASVSAGPSRGSTRSTSRSAREEPSLTTTSRPSRHCGRRTSPRTRVGSSRSPTSTPLRVPSASLTRQSGSGVQTTVHSAGRCATETAGTRSGYACPISRTGRFLACARWRTASRCLYPRSVRGYACASPSRPCPTTSVSSAKAASTRSGPRLHPRPARHLLLRRRGHNPPRDRMENARDSRRKGRRPEKRNGAVTSNINTIR